MRPRGIDVGRLRLKATRDLLPPALLAAGAGVWDYDVTEDCVVACGTVARLYGLPDAVRVDGVPLARLAVGVHPEDRQAYLDRVAELRTRGGVIEAHYRTISARGDTCSVLVRGRCDFGEDGTVTHASGLVLALAGGDHAASESHEAAMPPMAGGTLAALNVAADYALASRRVLATLGPAASPALREAGDTFLRTLGHEIAAAMTAASRRAQHH